MTEVLEQDTFICESKYLEAEKAIKKFNKPMKKHTLTIQVCDDEVYFFKKPIIPNKVGGRKQTQDRGFWLN